MGPDVGFDASTQYDPYRLLCLSTSSEHSGMHPLVEIFLLKYEAMRVLPKDLEPTPEAHDHTDADAATGLLLMAGAQGQDLNQDQQLANTDEQQDALMLDAARTHEQRRAFLLQQQVQL